MLLAVEIEATESEARAMDAADELAPFAEQFYRIPGHVYLDGNSLGLLSKPAEASLLAALDQWKRFAVQGWTEEESCWFTLAEELGALTAPIVGAHADEVIVANSTSVNLHQLLAMLFRPEGKRTQILMDAGAFPSDVYAVRSALQRLGLNPASHLTRVGGRNGSILAEDEVVAAMSDRTALAILPSVVYTSGQLLDLDTLTREAHRQGILIGFDCSHSVGAIPHRLSDVGVDFAVWCNYKYVSGGPGAAAGLYLNRRHFGRAPGLAGWWGSRKSAQFDMADCLDPEAGAGGLQIGSPHILSMAPLRGALDMIAQAGIERLRAKSLRLTEYIMALADRDLTEAAMITPREDYRRGGHVALAHPEALRICAALRSAGVIPDYRPPDIIRVAPAPLYNSFSDCLCAIRHLSSILKDRTYQQYDKVRQAVT